MSCDCCDSLLRQGIDGDIAADKNAAIGLLRRCRDSVLDVRKSINLKTAEALALAAERRLRRSLCIPVFNSRFFCPR
jgi:hypothetical protein